MDDGYESDLHDPLYKATNYMKRYSLFHGTVPMKVSPFVL